MYLSEEDWNGMYLSELLQTKMVLPLAGQPYGISEHEFEKQLANFDSEISDWKSALERNEKPR